MAGDITIYKHTNALTNYKLANTKVSLTIFCLHTIYLYVCYRKGLKSATFTYSSYSVTTGLL